MQRRWPWRSAARDLEEWTLALPANQTRELDKLLRAKFEVGLTEAKRNRDKDISRVLLRGTIEDDVDFRLIHSYVDEICQDVSRNEEVEKLNLLLRAYEARPGRQQT